MKMTLHIDEKLLERVMKTQGLGSKTRTVDLALREMDRRMELVRLAREGLGLSPDELKKSYDPASAALDALPLNEKPVTYGRKPRSR